MRGGTAVIRGILFICCCGEGWFCPANIGLGLGPVSKASLSWGMAAKPVPGPGRGVLMFCPRMLPFPGPDLALAFCRRRMQKARRATRAMRTARPPIVAPTITPVRFVVCARPVSGASVAGEVVSVVVSVEVEDDCVEDCVDDGEEVDVEGEVELEDETLELADSVSVELTDSVPVELEAVLVTVPSVVGSLSVETACVRLRLTVGKVTCVVKPLALVKTIVARSLAEPHPY